MKNLVKMMDLSTEDIYKILDLADQLKYNQRHGIPHRYLEGKTLAMIFSINSTRTRVSFENGMFQLGGHSIYLNSQSNRIEKGEPPEDTARSLSRYCDCVMVRANTQAEVERMAEYSGIPVINGLTDVAHPCQALADLMTLREKVALLPGTKACFIGDCNNMSNSLIVACLKMGMYMTLACPEGMELDPIILNFVQNYPDHFHITTDPKEAIQDSEVVYVDAWTSLGRERGEEERKKLFHGFTLTTELMSLAAPGAMVQHCLPAHRGEEITAEVFEAHADEIFEEAENRLHVQKAVLCLLLNK